MDQRAKAFARLCEAVPAGLYVGSVGPGGIRTLAANTHLKRILGYTATVADGDVTLFADTCVATLDARDKFIERLRAGGSVSDYLLQVRRQDGGLAWIEISAAATSEGDDLHVEAVIRDVTHRRQLDEQSRDLHNQLLQTEKLAALGTTISGVAHELNNPLATILSWAERLATQPADSKTERGLAVIRDEAERAARIVRNLLTFARKRQTTRMMVDLNEIVGDVLALRAYEQRNANIRVLESLAPELPEVFADSYQIKQVILNLIINAEQSMSSAGGGGTLQVRTSHAADRGAVVLEVHDNGPGIPEDAQGKVFDPFFTTKQVGAGTGLGLSVAYAIVQEHGGRIWLSSTHGAGASFFVELPVIGSRVQPATAAAAMTIGSDTFKGLRALVIEDEPALATAVGEALTDVGFAVQLAADGEEGLTRVTEGAYDLVVCDLKMPRIDGMQFYRAMAVATPALARRVIFVTGAGAGTEAERFLEETGCRWLAKPFRLGELLLAARDTLS